MATLRAILQVVAAVAALACGWAWSQGPKGRPAPTSFSKQTQDAFFKDVVRHHGEGTFAEVLVKPADLPRPAEAPVAWSKIITADALKTEITTTAHAIAPHLTSPAKWNAEHQTVRQLYSHLAVCLGVVAQYD